jgi:putative membrane protein
MMAGFDWGMGLGGWAWMVLGIVLLVLIVWALVSALGGRDRTPTDDAGQILRSRFARGEITEQEYEQARRLLGVK